MDSQPTKAATRTPSPGAYANSFAVETVATSKIAPGERAGWSSSVRIMMDMLGLGIVGYVSNLPKENLLKLDEIMEMSCANDILGIGCYGVCFNFLFC